MPSRPENEDKLLKNIWFRKRTVTHVGKILSDSFLSFYGLIQSLTKAWSASLSKGSSSGRIQAKDIFIMIMDGACTAFYSNLISLLKDRHPISINIKTALSQCQRCKIFLNICLQLIPRSKLQGDCILSLCLSHGITSCESSKVRKHYYFRPVSLK